MTTPPVQPNVPQRAWQPVPQRSRPTLAFEAIGIALGLLGMVALTTIILQGFGAASTTLATILAVVPLLMVLVAVRWIDRWEPEPRSMLLLAFFWGAGVSATSSFFLNTAIFGAVDTGDAMRDAMIGAAVVAPIVEETTKGLVLLLILWIRPRAIDGVVDGIVYAALSAGGFAFTENILYFAQYSETVVGTFVARALMSPFAHVSFTIMMGITIGIAARHRNRWAWTWLFPLGLVLAIAMHSLWNYSTFSSARFLSLYWFLQVPIFLVLAGVVVWLRREEAKMIRRRSLEYARAGWLTEREAAMLGSFQERGRAAAWAKSIGRGEAMKDMKKTATRLAYNRERAASGRAEPLDYAEQTRLLQELTAQRTAIYGTPALR